MKKRTGLEFLLLAAVSLAGCQTDGAANAKLRQHERPTTTEAKVQAYRYFKIESITLAAGETPHEVEPSSVPAPPLVRSKKELESVRGQWAMLLGKARYTFDRSGVASVTLVLADGFTVTHPLHRGGTRRRYRDGQTATLLARYRATAKPLVRGYGFCRGQVPRCGMSQRTR